MIDERSYSERLIAIQKLRAVAALLVLLHHVMQVSGPPFTANTLSLRSVLGPFGSAGVDLFFVISGFVIAHSLSSSHAISVRSFIAARATRILPLFWLMSAIYACQLWFFELPATANSLWNSVTLIPMPGQEQYTYPILHVGWSLAFELAFYLIVAMLLRAHPLRRPFLLIIALLTLAGVGAFFGELDGPLPFFLNPILAEFAMGVAAWLLWSRGLNANAAAFLTIAGSLLFVSGLLLDVGQGFETDPVKIIANASSFKRMLVWGLPASMIVLGTAAASSSRCTNRGLLARLGNASFSLYLVHPIVLFQIERSSLLHSVNDDLVFIALLITFSAAAALLVHRYAEVPVIKLAKLIHGSESGRHLPLAMSR